MATATYLHSVPAIPDSESLYEVVDGQVREKPTSVLSIHLASVLLGWMGPFVRQARLGRASAQMLYLLDNSGLMLRPDVSFVSYERWPASTRLTSDDAWAVVPDLAVEVVCQWTTAREIKRKIREYFAAGVCLVWIVYSNDLLVEVYESPTDVHILDRSGTLDGGTVLPGFRLALAVLFKDAIA